MKSSGSDWQSLKILVIDSRTENLRLLTESLSALAEIAVEDDEAFKDFDLCLIEARLYPNYRERLEARKGADSAAYLPVLGLLSLNERTETVIQQFDEVIYLPCTRAELFHRVENLLRARLLSVTNVALLERLRGQLVHLVDEQKDLISSRADAKRVSRELSLLANSLPQMIWTARPDGEVDYVNDRWTDYTGQSFADALGRGFICAIDPVHHQALEHDYFQGVSRGLPIQYQNRVRRFDGELRWFLVKVVPLKDEGEHVIKWFGSCTDINAEKAKETELKKQTVEAETANQTKSAFLANMSHEIRTPLGIIVGFSSLLKDAELDAEERNGYVEKIIQNGQALTTLIDDILDLAKVEAGKVTIEKIDFSFYDLLNECVDLFKDKARQKGIYITLNIPDEIPPDITSDPTRIRQILINLIGNAIKFTNEGGVRVSVRAENRGPLRELSIAVKDTGIGLSDGQRQRLFKPFTQADETTTRKYGGTGLGLILSKRLAEALDGDIEISDCHVGDGCTFTFRFVSSIATGKVRKATSRTAGPTGALEGLRLLVVDDSSDNLFLAARMLRKEKAIVSTAVSGEEALRSSRDQTLSCILLDIQMPGMDGFATLRELRQQGCEVPVIALTAHAMVEERRRTEAAGFNGHVTKPMTADVLVAAILSAVRGNNLRC